MAKRKAKRKAAVPKEPERFVYDGEQVRCYVCGEGLVLTDDILTVRGALGDRAFFHRKCSKKLHAATRAKRAEVARG